jgi:hypothetical protein
MLPAPVVHRDRKTEKESYISIPLKGGVHIVGFAPPAVKNPIETGKVNKITFFEERKHFK